MKSKRQFSRRETLKGMGMLGTSMVLGAGASAAQAGEGSEAHMPAAGSDLRQQIFQKVMQTPLIDTHEHLLDEKDRLACKMGTVDDWSMLLSMYACNDMIVAQMPKDHHERFFHATMAPQDKWKLLEPYWPLIKNTGYGRAVRITLDMLYGVEDLSAATVEKVQAGYEKVRQPGFYKKILCDMAKIESCQVNDLEEPVFRVTSQPDLLMQDISIVAMFAGPDFKRIGAPTGIEVKDLADWHKVIDGWFAKYGPLAVAVKSQNAYGRNIDYEKTPAEKVEAIFAKKLRQDPITETEQKALTDHLFWYCVEKATAYHLPVKLHTGYYSGENNMPLSRLMQNPDAACDLCRQALETSFVFMHICYPYYEPMITLAKHYANAYIDMCWSWIINPVAAKDFLKKFLVTAPAHKILTFGGDYVPVEPVLGHAMIARRGIALALSELVEEGWLGLRDALDLTDLIMHKNARCLFRLKDRAGI